MLCSLAFWGILQCRRMTSSPLAIRTSHCDLPLSQETSTRSACIGILPSNLRTLYCKPITLCGELERIFGSNGGGGLSGSSSLGDVLVGEPAVFDGNHSALRRSAQYKPFAGE